MFTKRRLGIPQARYEHPYVVRLCHWLSAISLTVMIGSGIEIPCVPEFRGKDPAT
jgi:Ni,Fe-hydrogenase I cytochrome b subunit